MIAWFVTTLRQNAELAIFLALAIGYFIGPLKIAGFTLGNVTACLLAGVLVGQLNVAVPGQVLDSPTPTRKVYTSPSSGHNRCNTPRPQRADRGESRGRRRPGGFGRARISR